VFVRVGGVDASIGNVLRRRFFEVYCPVLPAEDFTIAEIGSQNVNGSLREVCPADAKYIGIDLVEGDG